MRLEPTQRLDDGGRRLFPRCSPFTSIRRRFIAWSPSFSPYLQLHASTSHLERGKKGPDRKNEQTTTDRAYVESVPSPSTLRPTGRDQALASEQLPAQETRRTATQNHLIDGCEEER